MQKTNFQFCFHLKLKLIFFSRFISFIGRVFKNKNFMWLDFHDLQNHGSAVKKEFNTLHIKVKVSSMNFNI